MPFDPNDPWANNSLNPSNPNSSLNGDYAAGQAQDSFLKQSGLTGPGLGSSVLGALGLMGGPPVNGYNINGGAASIPGYDQWRQNLAQGSTGLSIRGSGADANQQSLYNQLNAQSQGFGPSLAQAQLQQGTDQNMAQAMALSASQNGGSRDAGVLRQIGQQRAGISQQMAQDSGQLRLQEQMGARSQMGALAGQMRGQDQSQQAMNDQMTQFYTQQGMSLDQAQMQAQMQMEQMRMQQNLGLEALRQKSALAGQGNMFGFLNSLGSMGAKAAGM